MRNRSGLPVLGLVLAHLLPATAAAQTTVPTEAIATAIDTVHAVLLAGDLEGEEPTRAIDGVWREESGFGGAAGGVPSELAAALDASVLEWEAASLCDGGPGSCRMPDVPVVFRVGYRVEASDRITVRIDAKYRTKSSFMPVPRRTLDVVLRRAGTAWEIAEVRTRAQT